MRIVWRPLLLVVACACMDSISGGKCVSAPVFTRVNSTPVSSAPSRPGWSAWRGRGAARTRCSSARECPGCRAAPWRTPSRCSRRQRRAPLGQSVRQAQECGARGERAPAPGRWPRGNARCMRCFRTLPRDVPASCAFGWKSRRKADESVLLRAWRTFWAAGAQVEMAVKLLVQEGNHERINAVINLLVSDFALSSQANHRKARHAGLVPPQLACATPAAHLHSAKADLALGLPCVLLARVILSSLPLLARPTPLSRVCGACGVQGAHRTRRSDCGPGLRCFTPARGARAQPLLPTSSFPFVLAFVCCPCPHTAPPAPRVIARLAASWRRARAGSRFAKLLSLGSFSAHTRRLASCSLLLRRAENSPSRAARVFGIPTAECAVLRVRSPV